MIKDIQELNFPDYATMSAATCSLPDMGEWNITSQIKIDGQIAPDFSFDWEVVFQGHKYIQPLRKPQGSKENTSFNSVIDLTFQHWAQYQLKRWYFFAIQPSEAGVAWPDKYIASVSLNLGDFCNLLGQILEYYYGDIITVALNPEWQYKSEAEVIEISYSHIWDVLIKLYEVYGVRWQIEPNGSPDKYVIKVGYPTTEQSHIFEYGFEGGLLKVERQVQSEEIANMLLGRGGEKNLPYRYFKNVDPENKSFPADPDWIEELANVYFSNLMPATFRSYVQGWKAAHLNVKDKDGKLLYEGYEAVGEANAYAPWAYRKGFTDEKFDPVEYVADEITINPETGDKIAAISPTYSPYVKKDSSIAKYGPLLNGLEDNDEIYPTIQGVTVDPFGRIDEAVEVEPITSDDITEAIENDAQITTFEQPWPSVSGIIKGNTRVSVTLEGDWFRVPAGKTANFDEGNKLVKLTREKLEIKYDFKNGKWIKTNTIEEVDTEGINLEEATVVLIDETGRTVAASGIPAGRYRYVVTCKIHNTTDEEYTLTVSLESPTLTYTTLDGKWRNTWRIWVKNIWGSSRNAGESDVQYAERVWRPILGDREGNEAKVIFASGMLAHEDYEFVITTTPKYERKLCKWQTVQNGEVIEHEYWSEWCIELGKSDADLESLGVYLPSTMRQAVAGDFFFFIGIDMPYLYTIWAEKRVDEWKTNQLQDKKDIKPTWVVQTDRVRLNGEGKEDALIRLLHPGDTLRLADKRFITGVYETLYLQSLTYTYREPSSDDAALNPDVEIVLSDSYSTSANPVATLQGDIATLTKQVGAISNIEQIVRAIGDKLYLRKDGIADRSLSPTEFASLLTSLGFRSGMAGGEGWGIYKDANGNWVIEADRFMARQELDVNNLVINQVTGQGGTIVESAARMEIVRVDDNADGYKCYFDQHEGTIANLFHVDDVAWNNRLTPDNAEQKFYRRRVLEVGLNYVLLSKSESNGSGVPAEGDIIIQFGNYTDKTRQYVKVRDVIGGGYERYIEGLDSVYSNGIEYYFVGRQDGQNPRWFIGNKDLVPYSGNGDGSFIEYKDRVFNLNNVTLSIGSKVGNTKLGDVVKEFDASKYLREALNQSTTVSNGLVLTSAILLGRTNEDGTRETWAGHNGLYKNGKTIASWWGGNMVDRFFDENGKERTSALTTGFAAALVRMDGSAYWAKGNIGFEADGSGWLGNYERGIRFGSDGSMLFGNGIKINLNGGSEGLQETLESLLNFNAGIAHLLEPCDAQNQPLTWQEAIQSDGAGGIKAKSLKAKVGLWGEQWISALGVNPDSGTVGGGASMLRELSDVFLNNPTEGQALVYVDGKWTNRTIATGLDTDSLAQWLSANDYAKRSDIPSLSNYYNKTEADNRYVNVAGDTMTGVLKFANPSNTNAQIGSDNVYGIWLQYALDYINIRDGELWWKNGSRFWHAGNDGSGSGLDADTLDGLHEGSFMRQGMGNLTSAAQFDAILRCQTNSIYDYPDTFEESYGTVVTFNSGTGNFGGQFFLPRHPSDSSHIFYRGKTDVSNSWSEWKKIAFLTDNVASASRLKTSDTFSAWGQTFFANGVPQSVNGVFRELVAGSLNGGVAHSILNNSAAPYGLITRIYGNGMVSLQAQREATTSECFSLTLNPFGGNVGVGTLTPAYKFDVAGDVRSTSQFLRTGITGSSWNNGAGAYNVEITNNSAQTPLMVAYRAGHSPAVTGADRLFAMEFLNIGTLLRFCFGGAEKMSLTNAGLLTPKSLKIGECVISYDETNGALHFSSPLYSDGFITALGAGGVSGGDSSGGAGGVDILQEWGQYNSGTSKQTALSAYLGWELRQSLANCVTLNTAQDIDAYKNFTQGARFLGTGAWFKHANGTEGVYMGCNEDGVLNFSHHSRWAWQKKIGSLDVDGYLTMKAFVKEGGTSSQILMGDGTVTTKISANAPTNIGWTSVTVDSKRIPDMSFLAYWDGSYNGTSSNLKYCWRGLFGTMVTETADDYLKRSGGIISGATDSLLQINSTNALQNVIVFKKTDINKGQVGYNVNMGTVLYNYASNKYLGIKDDGTPHFNGNTILHAGNYNSYALPLSGGTLTGPLKFSTADGTNAIVGADNSYGAYLQYGSDYINVRDGNLWKNNSGKFWHSNNDGSGSELDADLLDGRHASEFAIYQNNELLTNLKNRVVLGTCSSAYISDDAPINEAGGYISFGDINGRPMQMYGGYGSNRWFARGSNSSGAGSFTTWREFAFTDSNVASATKLANARYLWGQLFDGSGSITGSMYNVRNITPEGHGEWHLGLWDNHFADIAAGEHYSRLDSPLIIRQYKAQPIEFYTNAIKRLTITENGDIVIGNVTLRYDSANNCLKIIGGGLVVEKFITALEEKV